MNKTYCLIYGDPIEGLSIIGPFTDQDQAQEYGHNVGTDYWVTELEAPEAPEEDVSLR